MKKKTLQTLTVGCLLLGLIGCSITDFSVDSGLRIRGLSETGRYQEIATLIENQPDALPKLMNREFAQVCQAYSKLKQYNKLFACLQAMERQEYMDEYYRTWRYLLRAEAMLDFGDTKRAVEQAAKAYDIAFKSTFRPENFNPAGSPRL